MTDDQLRDLLHQGYADEAGTAPPRLADRLVRRARARRRWRRGAVTGLVAAVAGVAVAPALRAGEQRPGTPRLVLTAATLQPYAGCPALLGDLVKRSIPLVGPDGFTQPVLDGGLAGVGSAVPSAAPSAAAAAPMAPLAGAPAATGSAPGSSTDSLVAPQPQYHSVTTDRTRGVDEPDTAKTDGTVLVTVGGSTLHVTDPLAARQLGSLQLAAAGPLTLLLVGTRAVVLGGAVPGPVAVTGSRAPASSVTVVDLADPSSPRVERTLSLTAEITGARLLGGTVRLVTRTPPPELRVQGSDGTRDAALAAVRGTTADDWLPTYSVIGPDGRASASGRLYDCAAVEHPGRGDGVDQTGVLSLDPTSDAGPEGAVAVLGTGDTTYATGTSVWVATSRGTVDGVPGGPPQPLPGGPVGSFPCCRIPVRPGGATTQLHLFDVADAAHTRYVASGELPGALHDQTALDQTADGTLRVVTTAPSGTTGVTTVRPAANGTLTALGRLDGLAAGEQVQAVRFVGDLAYVVTFRQTDPLTVLDLSQPTAPRLRGTLRTPGYSALLTESEPGRLLGVGMAGSAAGRLTGVGVGLFDVRDADAPKQVAALQLAGGGGGAGRPSYSTSAALGDPHAFLYWRPARLAMLPLQTGGTEAALACVHVDAAGLQQVYTLSQDDQPGRGSPAVLRALVVGPHVVTVSERGVMTSSLATGARQGWAPFAP